MIKVLDPPNEVWFVQDERIVKHIEVSLKSVDHEQKMYQFYAQYVDYAHDECVILTNLGMEHEFLQQLFPTSNKPRLTRLRGGVLTGDIPAQIIDAVKHSKISQRVLPEKNMSNQQQPSPARAIVDQRRLDDAGHYHEVTLDPRVTMAQMLQMMRANGGGMGFMMRVCDGCRGAAGADCTECACTNAACQQHYDLCKGCVDKFAHTKCPPGYGCGNIQ